MSIRTRGTGWFRIVKRCMISVGVGGGVFAGCYGTYLFWVDHTHEKQFYEKFVHVAKTDMAALNVRPTSQLPSRSEILRNLQEMPEFDVLVIGGGASGAGVALDSQTRGLKTALVEMDDFSSGTSSKSTKLIHGGVRYLQSAIMKLDMEQYKMVKEALFERANLLEIAPHLSSALPIMLPIYRWWHVPYFWIGIKMYDMVSGKRVLKPSYYISKSKALHLFPMLKKDSLKGALIYYDGQHNDARMNLSIVLTAIRHGAQCINHTEAVAVLKNEEGKVCGARVKDLLTGKELVVKSKCVVNATGPFTDGIRLLDNPSAEKICIPSQGVHIVLPGYYSPSSTGLLDPETSDGRVIFFLPWEKATVAGTTDSPSVITHSPVPEDSDVEFILNEVRNYLSPEISVRRGDVLSAWAGLRPLVRDPSKRDTKSLARNHIIEISSSNMVTIAGGKWTTYRHMAEETVDAAIETCALKPGNKCVTSGLLLEGAHDWDPLLHISLVQDYGLEADVAHHLSATYGDRAYSVAKMAKLTGKRWPVVGTKVHPEFFYLESEILYAVQREYACTVVDMLARRFRLAFLNTWAAEESLPKIVEIMAKELKWDRREQEAQLEAGRKFLEWDMGKTARARAVADIPMNLTPSEMKQAKERFENLDRNRKGHITVNDLRRHFRDRGEKLDEKLLHELLGEIDLKKNGQVEFTEFLLLYSGLKGGQVTQNRLAKYLGMEMDLSSRGLKKSPVLSGGGV